MKRMLINATQKEELRIALVDGQYLYDLDIESVGKEQKKANIYKGVITKVNPSLEAVFVAYGGERDGFLPFKDIAASYFPLDKTGKRNIRDLKEGQEVLVQIEKEIRGKKGAALTTYISLAGSFLVLKPNDERSGGISRHIQGRSRIELKKHLNNISIPKEMSVIARTASLDKTQAELQQDLNALIRYWNEIQEESQNHAAPILIHKEIDVITRVFRDYLRDDISEILLDNSDYLENAKKSLTDLGRTDFIDKLHLYQGDIGLFNHFQIEHQIESAFSREVRLKSGGSIVIDVTEALTAIDINSSKSTKGADIEETALTTNLEAAEEVARQLRFRDLGGLIVIDFIDMKSVKNQRAVEDCLKEHIQSDRARIQTTKISRFGLIEMSRQRLSSSLKEATHHICPRCEGTGTIRDNNSLSLSILRLIQEAVLKENTSQVEVIVPVEIASYLLNEKRQDIAQIEANSPNIKVIIAADSQMDTPAYKLIRKRFGEESGVLSYQLPKLIKEQDESEIEPVEIIQPEKAILTGFKIDQVTDKSPSVKKVINTNAPGQTKEGSMVVKWIDKIKGLFASPKIEKSDSTQKVETSTQSEKAKKTTLKPKTKPSNRVNRSRTDAKELKKEEPQEALKIDQKEESKKVAKEGRTKITRAQTDKSAPKPVTPKVKREKRVLEQSVRVKPLLSEKSKNKQQDKEPELMRSALIENVEMNAAQAELSQTQPTNTQSWNVIPSLLNSVIQFNLLSKKEYYKSRPRRTLRHLRMNNQRKRRQNYKDRNPFNFASAALEVALCRVYPLEILNAIQTTEEIKLAVASANDVIVSKSVTIAYPAMGQILQALMPLPKEINETVTKMSEKTVAEITAETTDTENIVQVEEVKPTNERQEEIAHTLMEKGLRSSAPMTKATSVATESVPCQIQLKSETTWVYATVKGAGALTAKEQVSSLQSKS